MEKALQYMKALIADEEGATAIEYGLMAALIAAVLVTAVTALGGQVVALFTTARNIFP